MVAARSWSLSSLSLLATSDCNNNRSLQKPRLDGGSADLERNVALFNAIKKACADAVHKANIESVLKQALACVRGAWGCGARSPPGLFFLVRFAHFFLLHHLGSGRAGWSWTANNIRAACARLGRTNHVRTSFTALVLFLAMSIPDGGSFVFRRHAPCMSYWLTKENA